MNPAHRRYLLMEQGVGAAVVNFLLNALIAAVVFRHYAVVPLWGQQSIAGDTVGTTFVLPLLTCLIVTRLAHRQIRAGTLAQLDWTRTSHPLLGWLPTGTLARAAVLGVVCAVLTAPATVWMLAALDVTAMSFGWFVLFKATFAAALAAIVTPVVALWAISRIEPPPVPNP